MSLSSLGLLGRKVGMMRLFTDEGDAVPVTVIDVSNNRVTQVKSQDTDGYVALQVTFGSRKASRVTKPHAGHLGDVTVTVQNLDVVRVDEARGLLMVRGAVPGAKNGFVTVRLAAKGQPKPVAAKPAAEKGKK